MGSWSWREPHCTCKEYLTFGAIPDWGEQNGAIPRGPSCAVVRLPPRLTALPPLAMLLRSWHQGLRNAREWGRSGGLQRKQLCPSYCVWKRKSFVLQMISTKIARKVWSAVLSTPLPLAACPGQSISIFHKLCTATCFKCYSPEMAPKTRTCVGPPKWPPKRCHMWWTQLYINCAACAWHYKLRA